MARPSPSRLFLSCVLVSTAGGCIEPFRGVEWVVDERSGCCVELRHQADHPPHKPCSCTCAGNDCTINEPTSPSVSKTIFCDALGAQCASKRIIDLSCGSQR